jgi:hypothetical protein
MMHPSFREMMMREHQRDLERRAHEAHRLRPSRPPDAASTEPVVLRLCCVRDDNALERLAAVEGRPAPAGRHVVAEVGGVVVAALPLGPGTPFADPFRPTAHLLPLLELRARQLTAGRSRGRPLALRWAARAWSRA